MPGPVVLEPSLRRYVVALIFCHGRPVTIRFADVEVMMRAAYRRVALAAVLGLGVVVTSRAALWAQDSSIAAYKATVDRIIAEATSTSAAWQRLAAFTDMFPARLSGSRNLERAIAWAADEMKRDGLANVHLEPVKVPHWVRGHESAALVEPYQGDLAIAGLGGSIGTPPSDV